MKKQNRTETCRCDNCYICTRSQKIWAWLALFGIFFCGVMTGYSLWGGKNVKSNHKVEEVSHVTKVRKFLDKPQNPCKMREDALLQQVRIGDNLSDWDHNENAKIYMLLSKKACTENQQKYHVLAEAEYRVVEVLRSVNNSDIVVQEDKPCTVIEKSLIRSISDGCGTNSECYLRNAEVLSKIAEDGCPENSEMYKQRALNELQIAEGVRVDEAAIYQDEMRSTVNTYKKLQMQNEAKKYIKKVEKLVNPGVDFIMELQRVIEE